MLQHFDSRTQTLQNLGRTVLTVSNACRSCYLIVLATMAWSTVLMAEDAVPKPIKIALIGDSTVSTYTKPPADRPDLTGWGQVFGEFFTDRVTVLNHASSGRSSKSFRRENRW